MKKKMMKGLVGVSLFTCGTASSADNSNMLQDTNGNVLKTGTAYCIRPMNLEPKINVTVDESGRLKADDNSVDCQYAYKLVGDDRVNNRTVITGETVRFEEMKKEFDGAYRNTNNFLKADDEHIYSAENEYTTMIEGTRLPRITISYEFAKFQLESTNKEGSEMRIKYNGNYVWKTPFTILWNERWITPQDQNNGTGVTNFEFKSAQ